MNDVLRTIWRKAPVTTCVVAAAVVVQFAVTAIAVFDPAEAGEAHRRMGAVRELVVVAMPEVHGPFDLWNGGWWRVLVSPFHHGPLFPLPASNPLARLYLDNLPHLLLNAAALLYLGAALEPRTSRVRFVAFTLGSLVVSSLPGHLLGQTAVGLSGLAFALLGLVTIRRLDAVDLAERVPIGVVRAGFVWLVMFYLLTQGGLLAIANEDHLAGLLYGLAWGWVERAMRWRDWRSQTSVAAFALAHVAVPMGIWFSMHPTWNGMYHWYRSLQAETDSERLASLEQAVSRDPGLSKAWLQLAQLELDDGRELDAWRTLVRSVDHNRSDAKAAEAARRVWELLDADERGTALRELADRFGSKAEAWQERLGGSVEVAMSDEFDTRPKSWPSLLPPDSDDPFATYGTVEKRSLLAPEIDPTEEDSAALGTRL